MRPLADELVARGYRVLAPDLRGHGASPRGGPYTVQALANDLVESLPAGVELAAGHSVGGKVLPWAVRSLAPQRVIYLDPAWIAPPAPPGGIPLAKEDGSPMNLDDARRMHPDGTMQEWQAVVNRYLATDWRMFRDPLLQIRQPPCGQSRPRRRLSSSQPTRANWSRRSWPRPCASAGTRSAYSGVPGTALYHEDMATFLTTVNGWI